VKIGQVAGRTDPGRKRRRNEDAYVCEPPLFAVADGMGGAQAGELASGLAAGALKESQANGGGEQRVTDLIREANRRVHDRATSDAAASGMGTTITVALVEPNGRVAIGHVGDSRAYLLRDGRLEQLTDDHSLVAELVRRGELSPAEAEVHPQRSVITRVLGTEPDVDVDAFSVEAKAGDLFLLCSDGLSTMVTAEDIERIVARYRGDLDAGTRALVHAANRGGGEDNITAVLFEVVEAEAPDVAVEPDEATRERVAVDPDEEETLHPEDNVAPPPPAPRAVDTMVVPADQIRAAVEAEAARETAAAETTEKTAAEEEQPSVSIARRLLVLLVIAALAALIVVLVVWGLAR
jgi:serine/threonine protein phosphatase PrpC